MPAEALELVFLGTGTSHGVPMIGCDCAVCRSHDPRDRRNRASAALLTPDGRVILIDTTPELRLAAVACNLMRLDAILFTHGHADHIMGLDDVRRFNDLSRSAIPGYGNRATVARLREVFGYAEVAYQDAPTYRPSVRLEVIDGPREICGLEVIPVPLLHGREEVLGFRIGKLAYCTDCSMIPPTSWDLLAGLDLLVLDALRHTPHPTHFNLSEAVEMVAGLKPRRALFTHITHELPHAATNASLPENVQLAYDGQVVTVALA
jgi:phosphoribosyl 1,2-cyclic phosphate phosphodiesterase